MKRFSRLLQICFAGILLFMLCSCSSQPELGDVSVVTGIFLDFSPSEQRYQLICEIADFAGYEKTSNISAKLLYSQGKTISDALVALNSVSQKDMYFSHAKMILLGSGFQSLNLKSTVEYFMNHPDINSDIRLCMAAEGVKPQNEEDSHSFFEPVSELLRRDNSRTSDTLYSLYQKEEKCLILPVVSQNEDSLSVSASAVFYNYQYETTFWGEDNQLYKLIRETLSNESFSVGYENYVIQNGKTRLSRRDSNLILNISLQLNPGYSQGKSSNHTPESHQNEDKLRSELDHRLHTFFETLKQENKLYLLWDQDKGIIEKMECHFYIRTTQDGILNKG